MTEPPPLPRGAAGTRAVLAGGVVSSLGAYLFQVLGARVLGDTAYAPIGILWTLQYLLLTIGLLSVEAWVTSRGGVTTTVWRWLGGLTVAAAVGIALVPGSMGGGSMAWPAAAAAIVVGFGLFVVVRGQLAAKGDLAAYGLMTGGESILRLVLAGVLLGSGAGAQALAFTLPAGAALVAIPWLGRLRSVGRAADEGRGDRTDVITRGHTPAGAVSPRAAGFLVRTTLANGIAQVLLAAGPLVVALLGGSDSTVTVVFVTTTAARAPMVLIHSGTLARILPPMRQLIAQGRSGDLRGRVRRATLPLVAVLAAISAIGAVAGPTLVALTFGGALRPSATFAGLTALSVGLTMVALVLNQVAIAADAESTLVGPWLFGLAVAGSALGLTAGVEAGLRVALASALGLAGAVVVVRLRLVRVLDHGPSPTRSDDPSTLTLGYDPRVHDI